MPDARNEAAPRKPAVARLLSRLRSDRGSATVVPAPSPERLEAVRGAVQAGRPRVAARLLARTPPRWRASRDCWRFVAATGTPDQVVPVAIRVYADHGLSQLALGILEETDLGAASTTLHRRAVRLSFTTGRFERAREGYAALVARRDDSVTDEEHRSDRSRLALCDLHLAANRHCSRFEGPRGDDVEGFVLVHNLLHQPITALMTPLVGPLLEAGYAVGGLTRGSLVTTDTGIEAFERVRGSVTGDGTWWRDLPGARPREWRIDWAQGIAEHDGLNYYSFLHERLGQRGRAYRVDVDNDPAGAEHLQTLLRRSERALDLCESLVPLAESTGKPVRIALMEPHMAPAGVIRHWCQEVGRHHGIHVVPLSVGYENYYNNLGSLIATTVAVEDMTAQPDLRMPFLGGLHRLEVATRDEPGLGAEPDDEVLSWICQDRSRVDATSGARAAVVRRAEEVRAAGGKVFVALGKVSIDFAAPGDRGFAHADFVEWVNHLVAAVEGSPNLLLIKPHPHELREEIVLDGVQMLRELVVPELPGNVVFLEHHGFNTHELAEVVDGAFLWNGTAMLEFSVLGVPVYPASTWAVRDYPVGVEVLRTRADYEDVLQGRRTVRQLPETRRRAAAQLRLMRSDHVAIPYEYAVRPAVNSVTDPPVLDEARLERLVAHGDPYVDRIASRFFEFA